MLMFCEFRFNIHGVYWITSQLCQETQKRNKKGGIFFIFARTQPEKLDEQKIRIFPYSIQYGNQEDFAVKLIKTAENIE